MDIELVDKSDSAYHRNRLAQTSLPEAHANVHPDTVCRSCALSTNRFWFDDHHEDITKREGIRCEPTKELVAFKMLATKDRKGQRRALNARSTIPTVSIVSSCGQSVLPKCLGCDRFIPITVDIPYDPNGAMVVRTSEGFATKDGFPVRYWRSTIGGRCSIPAGGITVDGQAGVTCDRIPRKVNVENPSCANCHFQYRTGEQWQTEHLEVNDSASLDAWERHLVSSEAAESDVPYGVLYNWMLTAKMSSNHGRQSWHRVEILRKDYRKGTLTYKVRIPSNNVVAIIADDDDRFWIEETQPIDLGTYHPGKVTAALVVRYPHHQMLGVSLPRMVFARVWPPLPPKRWIASDPHTERIAPNCADCATYKGRRPCYFHAKAPKVSTEHDTITFADPGYREGYWDYGPESSLHLSYEAGTVVVRDKNDNLPSAYGVGGTANASVFRLHISYLLHRARALYGDKGVADVRRQYHAVIGDLRFASKPRNGHWSLVRSSTREAAKPYCAHPGGLDLRKVFGDSFGLERVDFDFDFGAKNTMEVEEEYRVGYRQHNLTPQRLQEEILANESIIESRTTPAELAAPHETTLVKIEGIGGVEIETPAEFMDYLDTVVEVNTDDGQKVKMTRRRQLFGYDLSSAMPRAGNQSIMSNSADDSFANFSRDLEEDKRIEAAGSWWCMGCEEAYALSEIEDPFAPSCSNCEGPLVRDHVETLTLNPRAQGGIGHAIAKESPRMLEDRRLQACLCPNWALRGAPHITLDSVKGASKDVAVTQIDPVTHIEERVVIHKVAELTDEHREANVAYRKRLEECHDKREKYMEAHPEISPAQIVELFPTPEGVIYQVKAAGSLAKMG